jgi:hypothetical protein
MVAASPDVFWPKIAAFAPGTVPQIGARESKLAPRTEMNRLTWPPLQRLRLLMPPKSLSLVINRSKRELPETKPP